MLRASTTDSSNAMTSLVGDLPHRKTRIKQIENAENLSGRQLLHGELGVRMKLQEIQSSKIYCIT